MNCSDLTQAEVLAALYNSARPLGLGFLQYRPKSMTLAEAQELLDAGQMYFDYVFGRVMKVDLKNLSNVYTALYNRDNGIGAAESAVEEYRRSRTGA